MHLNKTAFVKNLTAYVTILSLHFINFSRYTLSEFMPWKKDIIHNNSLLILKESSCVFQKNIKQLLSNERVCKSGQIVFIHIWVSLIKCFMDIRIYEPGSYYKVQFLFTLYCNRGVNINDTIIRVTFYPHSI